MEWWKTFNNNNILKIEKCIAKYRIETIGISGLEFPYYEIKTYEDQNGKFRARTDVCYRHKKTGKVIIFEETSNTSEEDAIQKLLLSLFEFYRSEDFFEEYELDWLPYYQF